MPQIESQCVLQLVPHYIANMPAELRKRKEKAPPAKAEDMPPAKKAAKATPAPKRKGERIRHASHDETVADTAFL